MESPTLSSPHEGLNDILLGGPDIAQDLYSAAEFRNQLLGRALDVLGDLEGDVEGLFEEDAAKHKVRSRHKDAAQHAHGKAARSQAGQGSQRRRQSVMDRSFVSAYSRATTAMTAETFYPVEEALLNTTEQRSSQVRRAYVMLSTLKSDMDGLLYELDRTMGATTAELDSAGAPAAGGGVSRDASRRSLSRVSSARLTAASLKAIERHAPSRAPSFAQYLLGDDNVLSESFLATVPDGDVMKEAVATSTAAARFRTRADEVVLQASKAKELALQKVVEILDIGSGMTGLAAHSLLALHWH